jgi:acetaldehyde dehydrogenase/alcohol dehydrogenase
MSETGTDGWAAAARQADEVVGRACVAAAIFEQLDQGQTDRIVAAVFRAAFAHRVRLAKLAAAETGMGVWEHKVLKNVLASQLVYESIKDEQTCGVIAHDESRGITEIAQPLGPIFGIIPVTNPTSTTIFKVLISLKTRNPIILSPSRKAARCVAETARLCYEAALGAEAPEDCVQCLAEGSRDLTQAVMSHPRLGLILATGGAGLVRSAYSSGTPAIGVGPGNVPVFIDASADLPFAVESIICSKTFDNGTICASEQAIVVEQALEASVTAEFTRQQCYFLSAAEVARVAAVAVETPGGAMRAAIVGQPVARIAELAGIHVPAGTRILLARLHGVGPEHPLSGEVLAPILAFYVEPDYEAALKRCIDLNFLGGIGHTASIYANDTPRIQAFAAMMNAGRVVVNTPSSQGAVGAFFNTLLPSLTLGCGSGGKNITTENISARHLINIKRVCRRRNNDEWQRFDKTLYYDESLDTAALLRAYHKNR